MGLFIKPKATDVERAVAKCSHLGAVSLITDPDGNAVQSVQNVVTPEFCLQHL